MEKIIACAPNISEGNQVKLIKNILSCVEQEKEVTLLKAHSIKLYNRTGVYFMGPPSAIRRTAIEVVKRACRMLDMESHTGDHPRIGIVDVLPFIPVKGVNMNDCIRMAYEVGTTLSQELKLPVFYYGEAAKREEYQELSNLRDLEYEGLKNMFDSGEIAPDEGPIHFNDKLGAIAIGAHHPEIILHIGINTNNLDIADKVAKTIRSSGKDEIDGTHVPGTLKDVLAVGGKTGGVEKAFLITAITNPENTPLYVLYNETKKALMNLGYDIEYSEIKSFVLKQYLIEAGEHFAKVRNKTLSKEKDIIQLALEEMKIKDFQLKKKALDA